MVGYRARGVAVYGTVDRKARGNGHFSGRPELQGAVEGGRQESVGVEGVEPQARNAVAVAAVLLPFSKGTSCPGNWPKCMVIMWVGAVVEVPELDAPIRAAGE